jgi:hypothetical protein
MKKALELCHVQTWQKKRKKKAGQSKQKRTDRNFSQPLAFPKKHPTDEIPWTISEADFKKALDILEQAIDQTPAPPKGKKK